MHLDEMMKTRVTVILHIHISADNAYYQHKTTEIQFNYVIKELLHLYLVNIRIRWV